MAQQEETGALKLWAPVAGLTLSIRLNSSRLDF